MNLDELHLADVIEVRCKLHSFAGCSCAPGPWVVTRIDRETGHISAKHREKEQTLGAHIDMIRQVEF